jgi:acetolactate synthase-1/2/3 large subunit
VISKRVKVDVPIVGNLKEVLVEMTAQLKAAGPRRNGDKVAAWWDQINEWRKKDRLKYDEASQIVKPQYRCHKSYGSSQVAMRPFALTLVSIKCGPLEVVQV